MLGHEDLEEQIQQFVAEQLSVKPECLRASTRLGDDLRVDGDDGVDFMRAFAVRFDVDLTGFEFDKHFGPEGIANPLILSWWLWWLISPKNRPKFVPITLADLILAAQEGRWLLAPAGLAAVSSTQSRKGAND